MAGHLRASMPLARGARFDDPRSGCVFDTRSWKRNRDCGDLRHHLSGKLLDEHEDPYVIENKTLRSFSKPTGMVMTRSRQVTQSATPRFMCTTMLHALTTPTLRRSPRRSSFQVLRRLRQIPRFQSSWKRASSWMLDQVETKYSKSLGEGIVTTHFFPQIVRKR